MNDITKTLHWTINEPTKPMDILDFSNVDFSTIPHVDVRFRHLVIEPQRNRNMLAMGEYVADWVLTALMHRDRLSEPPVGSETEEALMRACRRACREYIDKHLSGMNAQELAHLIGQAVADKLMEGWPRILQSCAETMKMEISVDRQLGPKGALVFSIDGWAHQIPLSAIDEKAIAP